ncbi:Macrolide export ATP-binding/permease protein MacB [Candidatus Izimaplasma bacterium HR1]|jgi:ABC-type lipoprotein export system ATPase subunit|uniref:ABC transporter ATP-binding protein/permease n=1 Tax=Candidatus Izimoplasma sp. HR1 TaxID=1541959 RepID=UPI0004F88F35|nr:Macrolide export ATP-binding/permease protein MacB [Candidatus Izimaplasma bacterium HR1]
MLRLENVSKYYYSGYNIVLALRKINLEFKIGEFVAITGESGSGKSTLLNILSGLDTYEDGKVFINEKDISHYSVDELENYRRDYIGFVFQDYNIIDSYTVYQNVEMALTVQGYAKEERQRKALELIDKVGLTKLKNQRAIKLSGGEKQRMVIARTLAKDCQVLVCDEPTGNLDVASSKQVLDLLHEISKDKLVIVVTHDFDAIKQYATRKIRLYDGEVIEDDIYHDAITTTDDIPSKSYYTRFIDMIGISNRNVFSVPKKSMFTMLVLSFLIIFTLYSYGNGIIELNKPYTDSTRYFENTDQSRLIVSKYDNTQFTDDELNEILEINDVRDIVSNDVVLDTILLTTIYNPAYGSDDFFYYKILPSSSLNKLDVLEGELPVKANEVVIGANGVYEVGDWIGFSDSYRLMEHDGVDTSQFMVKIVGLTEERLSYDNPLHSVYFTTEGLEEISPYSVFEHSQISLEVTGTTLYFTPEERWITDGSEESRTDTFTIVNNLMIDDSLEDDVILSFNMMFFDICRDFGYKKELSDDMDAGLCDASDFIDSHDFRFRSITTFESTDLFTDITILTENQANPLAYSLYMNTATFNKHFGETNYQITAVVYDGFNGKVVVEELREMGYKAYYPSRIIEEEDYLAIVINNVRVMFLILVMVAMIFFVGYFVLRNIVMSKQKDYLIYRSLGTSKRIIQTMIYLETVILTIFTSIIVIGLLVLLEQFKTPIPNILRFFSWVDYTVIFGGIFLILGLMIRNFSTRIFNVSVISSLKGVES